MTGWGVECTQRPAYRPSTGPAAGGSAPMPPHSQGAERRREHRRGRTGSRRGLRALVVGRLAGAVTPVPERNVATATGAAPDHAGPAPGRTDDVVPDLTAPDRPTGEAETGTAASTGTAPAPDLHRAGTRAQAGAATRQHEAGTRHDAEVPAVSPDQ